MDKLIGPFRMKMADRIFHDRRLDLTAFRGTTRRLPDRTLVYTRDYEQRLREYEEKSAADDTSTKILRRGVVSCSNTTHNCLFVMELPGDVRSVD